MNDEMDAIQVDPRTAELAYSARRDDLRVSALAHYDRVSLSAGEWFNQVPQAIDHWYRCPHGAKVGVAPSPWWSSLLRRLRGMG